MFFTGTNEYCTHMISIYTVIFYEYIICTCELDVIVIDITLSASAHNYMIKDSELESTKEMSSLICPLYFLAIHITLIHFTFKRRGYTTLQIPLHTVLLT